MDPAQHDDDRPAAEEVGLRETKFIDGLPFGADVYRRLPLELKARTVVITPRIKIVVESRRDYLERLEKTQRAGAGLTIRALKNFGGMLR
jgi:hypothetical protein